LNQEDSNSTNDVSKSYFSNTVPKPKVLDKTQFQLATKLHLLGQKKEENKMKMSSQLAIDVKETVKEEVFEELTEIIHNKIKDLGSLITVNQIQKISENKAESLKDDFKEIFDKIGSVSDKAS